MPSNISLRQTHSLVTAVERMCNIVEHFIDGLQQDCEQLRHPKDIRDIDSAARKKKTNHLYQLLSELIDTERNYVVHLETVSKKFFQSFI